MDEKNLLPGLQDRLELIRTHEALGKEKKINAHHKEREKRMLLVINVLTALLTDTEGDA